MKHIDTVIFDFNGTLYFDQDLNVDAWKLIYKEILGSLDNFDNDVEYILSVKDDETLKKLFKIKGIEANQTLLDEYAHKKESYYQALAIKQGRDRLADGAEDFLNYLKDNNYKLLLATASIKYNVDFYFNQCKIGRWFDRNNVAYDDGINKNKYDMYKKAIAIANTNIENIIAIDDSSSSINSALKAGIKKIIRINHYNYHHVDSPFIVQEIYDFNSLDYSLFKKC